MNFGVSLQNHLRSGPSLSLSLDTVLPLSQLNSVFLCQDHKRVADMEAYSRCCTAIEDMGKKLWALPCCRDANSSDMIKVLSSCFFPV